MLLAISCLGSAHRPLGVAAMTCGDHDLAVTRFQAALEANQRIGNRPIAALSRADLATALIARGKPGDAAWARELLAELSSATGLGGRIRSFGNSPERARTAVRKAIKRALACITEADNELGIQLTRAVHTGNVCRYDPDPTATHWKVVRQ